MGLYGLTKIWWKGIAMGGRHVGLVNDSINVEWGAHHGNGVVTWHGWLAIDAPIETQ